MTRTPFKCSVAVSVLLVAVARSANLLAAPPLYPTELALGQALFQDKNLGADRTVACASCHQPTHAFSDARAVSLGVHHQPGTRNAPSLLDINEYQFFFWDGRAATLEQQASVPFLAPSELGFKDLSAVVERVEENPRYTAAFHKLTGHHEPLRFRDVAQALIAYERSLGSAPNALDRYLAGDRTALSLQARQGLALFEGRARCAECHLISASAAPLTDNRFHSSGVGLHAVSGQLGTLAAEAARLPPAERYARIESDPRWSALGRYLVTLDPKDIGRFRTPSLRNVVETAPYMHDGSIATLPAAVALELYYRGLKLGQPILLTANERAALLAFLDSLSSHGARINSPAVARARTGGQDRASDVDIRELTRTGRASAKPGREGA